MAKLLKHFGIGGSKKNPPATPKPDYKHNNQKSSSVQDLTGRYQSSEHSCHGLCTASSSNFSSGSATYDGRSHSRIRDSPRFHRPFSTHSPIIRHKDLGAHSSTSASGDSSPGKEKHPASSGAASSLPSSELGSPEDKSGGNPTPPRLLDEYSDPFDLKKQIAENPESLGGLGVEEEDVKSVSDDDYSVPFEIKNMRDKKLREKEKQSKQNAARYENAKFEQTEQLGAVGGGVNAQMAAPQPVLLPGSTNSTLDTRPKEEYDDPWEWSTTHSIIFKEGEEVLPAHCVKAYPDQRTKNSHTASKPPTESMAATSGGDKPTASQQPVNNISKTATSKLDRHDYVNTNIAPPQGREEESADSKTNKAGGDVASSGAGGEKGAVSGGARPKEATQGATCHDKRLGNYEEPWDLSFTRGKLEECFKAKITTSDDGATAQGEEKPPPQAAAGAAQVQPGPDTRPQEGYEKPWDWKPDRKDDRQQEGYEKPWDWKPHQKDDRPTAEYDQPWDQKQAQLQQNLLKAKSAKEIKGSASLGMGDSQAANKHQVQDIRPKLDKHPNTMSMAASDTRPMDEYDQPWDKKTARHNISRTLSETSSQPPPAVLGSPLHSRGASPSHKHLSQQQPSPAAPQQSPATYHRSSVPWGTGVVGERIDPSLPLDKQGWYHGAISRLDAESLLRVHKEGSYLVRMSESNKLDFSLSLKSSRGFMHMKIVTKNRKYILGQFSQPFDCIPLMIYHYSINKLPIKGAEHMSLLHPIMHELL